MHREPDVGLDPGSPGSCPGPKAGAKPLRHSGIPALLVLEAEVSEYPVFITSWVLLNVHPLVSNSKIFVFLKVLVCIRSGSHLSQGIKGEVVSS